ncbi:hypothetical protein J5N97_016572 [Dioscorea zingiberensis]|uniref:DEUBAD domain-containing protein n=1 Tax=Dioscorea zingiberensis TaxID=325984 RepID=A0A9D5CLD7_9LILI|nr:hypothetical protein J5N97_016572 [Dioscorea zingiberensis]
MASPGRPLKIPKSPNPNPLLSSSLPLQPFDSKGIKITFKEDQSASGNSQKKALAKREQIGVAWTDMAPFVDAAPRFRSELADVLSVPRDIFNLDNLMEVLSYEVWATCLSESERELLTQLLPSGTGAEQVVHSLLTGENHHFGNPFLKWCSSLCSGNLHPDNVLRMEHEFRANKRAYYGELNKYHTDMLELLKKWKEKWTSSKDPEKLWSKGLTKHMQENSSVSTDGMKNALNSNKDIPHEVCITEDNASKYMSCIKISKKQLQLVKNLKQNGDGILPKSLNRVLGDMKDFVVEPYEVFEEGEKRRLHDLWSRVANKDISVAFDDWRDRKPQREKWSKYLKQELAESKKLMEDKAEEKNKLKTSLDNGESKHRSSIDMLNQEDVNSPSSSPQDRDMKLIPCLNNPLELNPAYLEQDELGQDPLNNAENSRVLQHFVGKSNPDNVMEPEDQVALDQGISKPPETSPLYSNFVENTMDMVKPKDQKSLCEHMLKPARSSLLAQFVAKGNSAENLMEQNVPTPSTKTVQTSVITQGSYYNKSTPGSHGHPTVGGLSLRQPQPVEKHPAQVIDMERNVLEQEIGEGNVSFGSYANQERNELLPPLPGGPQMLSPYPQQHINGMEQPGIRFLMANNNLSVSNRFSHQFQEQQLMEQRQAREKELYMQQMMTKNIYSNGRHPMDRQHFQSVGPHNLAAMPSSLNGGMRRHNWYADEHLASNGWPGLDSSSSSVQSLGDGVAADGSLFSVLSECSKLPSRVSYDDNRIPEQFMQARHSVSDGGITGNESIFGYTPRQLNSSTNNETAVMNPSTSSLNNMPWMNFPHQNQRPWNQ